MDRQRLSARVFAHLRAHPGRRATELADALDNITCAIGGAISGLLQQGRVKKRIRRGVARWWPVLRRYG